MTFILQLLIALLRVLLPAYLNRGPDTMEDSTMQPELRGKLHKRIRATWHRTGVVLLLLAALSCTAGCWLKPTRTVYVHPGEPVRIRETIRGAKVWVMDKDGKPVPGVIDIPEGWYSLPLTNDPVPLEEPKSEPVKPGNIPGPRSIRPTATEQEVTVHRPLALGQ